MKLFKSLSIVLFTLAIAGCSTTNSSSTVQDENAAGHISIEQTQVMLLIGGSKGEGILEFKGQSYPFTLSAVKLGGIGIHKLNLTGDVYYLENVEDFTGTYFSAEAALTLVKGKGGFWMKNGNGVKIKLTAEGDGAALGLGLEGVSISFTEK